MMRDATHDGCGLRSGFEQPGPSTSPSPSSSAAVSVIELLRTRIGRSRSAPCPVFLSGLHAAVHREPPPFETDLYASFYRTAATSAQWTVVSLVNAVQRRGRQARSLGELAARSAATAGRGELLRLAADESRDVIAVLDLIDLAFPGALPTTFRSQLESLAPAESTFETVIGTAGEPTIEELVAVHVAHLREARLVMLSRDAVQAHGPEGNRGATSSMIASLLDGQLDRAARTAALLEPCCTGISPTTLHERFSATLVAFYRSVSEEPIDFSYHLRFGNYP